MPVNTLPSIHERPIRAIKRIRRRQTYPRDGSAATLHVIVRLAERVGADHLKAIIRSNPSRQHQHIACLQSEERTLFAAEPECYSALRDAEYLMRVGMEVCVVVNRVGPEAFPSSTPEAVSKYLALLAVCGSRIARYSKTGSVLFGTSAALPK